MDILTQTISLLFRHRQTEIGRFGQDIDHIQRKQLHALLSTARKTEWGLKYDYKSIRSYSDFCQRLPLQTYDEIKPYVTRMINGERNILWPSVVRWYAKSSELESVCGLGSVTGLCGANCYHSYYPVIPVDHSQ